MLLSISQASLGCQYEVPAPTSPLEAVRYDMLQLVHTLPSGSVEEIPSAAIRAGCSTAHGGWYLDRLPSDDPNAPVPTKVSLCPCTCAGLGGGTLDFHYGCHPIVPPPLGG